MKKLLTVLALAIVLVFTVTACDSGGEGRTYSEKEYNKLLDKIKDLEDEIKELKGGGSNSGSGSGNSLYSSASVGDIIQFGGYDWRVLDIQDGKALILSDKVLTSQPYHADGGAITWENSSIREYLNGSFCDNMFTSEEKNMIAETKIANKANQWYGTSGGIDTIDKVFLLSLEEVVQYFGDSGQLNNRPGDASYIDDEYNSSRIAVDKDTGEATWWWLRSPGYLSIRAALVNLVGEVRVFGNRVSIDFGVRPALWLNL